MTTAWTRLLLLAAALCGAAAPAAADPLLDEVGRVDKLIFNLAPLSVIASPPDHRPFPARFVR